MVAVLNIDPFVCSEIEWPAAAQYYYTALGGEFEVSFIF
jgi:hypothetical protein